MESFAQKALSVDTLSPASLNLAKLAKESSSDEPILFLTTAGSDPSQELEEFASTTVGKQNYFEVPMGQGQQELASQLLRQCAESGQWLCLKNLHLIIGWLPELEKALLSLKCHEHFRLWLIAEPHDKFPTVLLQQSLKVTYESPPGIKRNMERTYAGWGPSVIEVKTTGSVLRAQTLFALAWFHAVCQERRSFIPQGWSKFYEFNYSDIKTAYQMIDALFKRDKGTVEWPFLHGLMLNAIYGGRIDQSFDNRVLMAYLQKIFSDDTLSPAGRATNFLMPNMKLPTTDQFRDYIQLVESLPNEDEPTAFGLPPNILNSWEISEARRVIGQLRHMRMTESTTDYFDRDAWSTPLTPLLNTWKKLNQGHSIHSSPLPTINDVDDEQPVNAFIQLEKYNAAFLVQTVHTHLAAVSRAIRGTAVLTATTRQLAASLLKQQTPTLWLKLWDGPEEPLEYITALMSRALAMQRWATAAISNTLLTDADSLDMSELFRPATFLNALRQQTARKIGTSMDELKLACSFGSGAAPPSGPLVIKVTGLQIEGAILDGGILREPMRHSSAVQNVPALTIAWVDKKGTNIYANNVMLPIYYDHERQKVVINVQVPCDRDSDKWLISGTALFIKS